MTERLKGALFRQIDDASVISVEKTRLFEGILKQDDCWQMTDYKIVMTNETYGTMNASITANDVTISMEFYLLCLDGVLLQTLYSKMFLPLLMLVE